MYNIPFIYTVYIYTGLQYRYMYIGPIYAQYIYMQYIQGLFCDGTRRYGVPGNENDENIQFVCQYCISMIN